MRLNWKNTSLIVVFAGALLLALAILGLSQDPPRGDRFPGGRGDPGQHDGLGPLARDLNLTDDQKSQIKKITDSFAENNKSLHDQLKALHENEPDPFSASFDEAAVRAAAEARAKIDVELAVAHAKMMSQIAGVLTTDQKAQLAAKRAQFGQRRLQHPPSSN
jgi:Spy/CpxP family protein refolding chaperone